LQLRERANHVSGSVGRCGASVAAGWETGDYDVVAGDSAEDICVVVQIAADEVWRREFLVEHSAGTHVLFVSRADPAYRVGVGGIWSGKRHFGLGPRERLTHYGRGEDER
jgi:hypothetical protein